MPMSGGEQPCLQWIKEDLSPTKRRALGVEPEHVVHPVLLGGWWCQSPSPKEEPDETAR
jgi:hypothetical protein